MGFCCCKCKKPDVEFVVVTSGEGSRLEYTYTMGAWSTVGQLKQKLDGEMEGIPASNMKLTLNGKVLSDDSKNLLQVGFAPKGTRITISLLNEPPQDIVFIASSQDESNWMTYSRPPTTTIGELMDYLNYSIQSIPTTNMKLILNGRELKNMKQTMVEAGFAPQDTKVFVLRIREDE